MKYHFKSEVTALDFWKLSMYHTYHALTGLVNIIFTVAMILLTAKFWNQTSDILSVLMIFGCCIFPIIQPIGVYARAKEQVATLPVDMELSFDEKGVHVSAAGQTSDLSWSQIKRVVKEFNMVIIFESQARGYMLTNTVLGGQKDEFYDYVESKINQKK